MYLLREDIVRNCSWSAGVFCDVYRIPYAELFDTDRWTKQLPPEAHFRYSQAVDFGVTAHIAHPAQTFVFDQAQILAFLNAVDRRLPPGDYPAPFEHMIIQFSKGIDEHLFTSGLRVDKGSEPNDEITALIIAIPTEIPLMNVVAWYKSTAINRVAIPLRGDGSILYEPLTTADESEMREQLLLDKQRIANLALLCLAYIHSPGIETKHLQANEAANRKRAAHGKRVLPDYYICYVKGTDAEYNLATGRSGRHVSFRFDVMGHFRRLPNGQTIWIKPHQRGVDHALYKPKVYKIS